MKAKTIQKMSTVVSVNQTPGFDRYNHAEPYRSLLVNLIERGEIPRYRGNEVNVRYDPDMTIIEITWNSRAGAEDYMAGLRELDPAAEIVFSIEIQDVID